MSYNSMKVKITNLTDKSSIELETNYNMNIEVKTGVKNIKDNVFDTAETLYSNVLHNKIVKMNINLRSLEQEEFIFLMKNFAHPEKEGTLYNLDMTLGSRRVTLGSRVFTYKNCELKSFSHYTSESDIFDRESNEISELVLMSTNIEEISFKNS